MTDAHAQLFFILTSRKILSQPSDFDTTGVLPASFVSWSLDTKYKHPLPIHSEDYPHRDFKEPAYVPSLSV